MCERLTCVCASSVPGNGWAIALAMNIIVKAGWCGQRHPRWGVIFQVQPVSVCQWMVGASLAYKQSAAW
jgi:hypothetical protein